MKNQEVKFTVEGLPPSSNHALVVGRGGRRYPSKEYLAWKEKVSQLDVTKILDGEWFEVERIYYFPLFYKNGNKRKKDVSNLDKYADDELCKMITTYEDRVIDDCEIKGGSHFKMDCEAGEERTEWTIWAIGGDV